MTITTLDAAELDKLAPHPIADLFPPLTGDDYLRLHAEIAQHGIPITNTVTLFEGMILSGRARAGIARQLRIPVPVIRYEDLGYEGTPLDYAIAQNCYRGHYTLRPGSRTCDRASAPTSNLLPRGRRSARSRPPSR